MATTKFDANTSFFGSLKLFSHRINIKLIQLYPSQRIIIHSESRSTCIIKLYISDNLLTGLRLRNQCAYTFSHALDSTQGYTYLTISVQYTRSSCQAPETLDVFFSYFSSFFLFSCKRAISPVHAFAIESRSRAQRKTVAERRMPIAQSPRPAASGACVILERTNTKRE